MASETRIVGAVWSYGSDSRAVVLTLGAEEIDWSEFSEATAAGALDRMEDVRQGRTVFYTHKSIPLTRVERVETDPPDPTSEPRRVGTLTIVTGGLLGSHDVVCAFEDECSWPEFLAFGARVEEAARAARATQQAPRPGRSLGGALRRLADRVLAPQPTCPRCGAQVQADWPFCRACGQALASPQAATCPRCGVELSAGSAFCPHCGARQG